MRKSTHSRKIVASSKSTLDSLFLNRAFELAERGRYGVSPNPMVGAVVVRRGRVVGEGFHRRAGGPHAEVEALAKAGDRARGADLYVTLEPCPHIGRTPPCTEAILRAGVDRVVAAATDPNPLVSGRGLRTLARAGVEVVRAEESARVRAERQNEKFRTWVALGRPFVLAKWASTLDGRIASGFRETRWITGREARHRALLLREEYDAVLVGAGTVLADDPRLTRRLRINRDAPHWRILLDGRLRVSPKARLFRRPQRVLIVTAVAREHPTARLLSARGVEVWTLPGSRPGRVSVGALLSRLAERGVASVMVEGGAATLWQFFRARYVDRVAVFLSPRILGGTGALAAV
ncbi:MAG TPA: bifunctional diaminohydroxyphosphoribosylaminopyrimidine deaminase/5-amino-6-(5-phosphoribosylamino)uracil reductase RibD, partial [Thermoanaerobaculia bacterium]|nr:bifunctional diaminohydroxyphosphoribosylaminopyrimidine deaminase/5-amino-6-(5-phosphoribosylamino)uracil reductase RibD [Thermoanaerobaculia bacterium]